MCSRRYHRMHGRNVLHALGYDAFGLPAEQYAVQTGAHPRATTEANIANMQRQLDRLGLGHDRAALARHHRRRLLPLDAVDLPAASTTPGTTRRPVRARPIAELEARVRARVRARFRRRPRLEHR